MRHNKPTKEKLNNTNNTIRSIPSGTLIYFHHDSYYPTSNNTLDSAITSSRTMSTTNHNIYRISHNTFSNIHKCQIIWNNQQHIALIYYEKRYPERLYLKIRTEFINAIPHFSNHLPISNWITP
jgi:hypothetical protein